MENPAPNSEVKISDADSLPTEPRPEVKAAQTIALPIKSMVLAFLIVVLAAGVGYKWFEWQTLSAFAQMHNEFVESELTLMDEMNTLAEEMRGEEEELEAEAEPTDEEIEKFLETGGSDIQKKFDEAKNDFAFFNEKYDEYENMLRDHQTKYHDFTNQRLTFVYGPRSTEMKQIASAMNEFYNQELADVQHGQVDGQLAFNISEAQKDMFLLQLYSINTSGFLDDQAVSDNFNDIAALEKYGRDDFKFERQDEIKQQSPYGYESLEKFRNYFKTSYSAIKDIVAGNFESAGYKFSRLGEETADLGTIDEERLEDEGKDQRVERKRKLVESLLARFGVVSGMSAGDKKELPVLGGVSDWNQELLACQAYIYKIDLYEEVREKYPEASEMKALVEEMNQVSPKTEAIDQSANFERITLVNDDKKIALTCKSEEGDEYSLTYHKEVEEKSEESEKAEKK